MSKFIDLTGKRFGKLTVIKRVENVGEKVTYSCRCDCGNIHRVQSRNLTGYTITTCGKCVPRYTNLVGKKFGNLTVLEFISASHGKILWRCQCICGKEVIKPADRLRSKCRRACSKNCSAIPTKMEKLIGSKIGRWEIIKKVSKNPPKFLCRCECGTEKIVAIANIIIMASLSCGCLRAEQLVDRLTTHGDTHTREYNIYHGMLRRCYDPAVPEYANYGGRGIAVCDRWREKYANFKEDRGKCPEGYSLERINNNGNYTPENTMWATREQQNSNKRNNVYIEYQGKTYTITKLGRVLGLCHKTLTIHKNNLEEYVDNLILLKLK